MEDNRNELTVVEDSELDEAEYAEEEATSGVSMGTLAAGLVLGALGAIGVRKGVSWWKNRKAKIQYIELDPDEETEYEDSEEELEED